MKALYREIAACPSCRGKLGWEPDVVVCQGCARRFRVENGIPILDLSEDVGSIATPIIEHDTRSWPRRAISSFLAPGNTTYKAKAGRDRQQRFIDDLGPDAIVLNVGSGTDDYGPRVINLEIGPFQNVDVVGRSEWLPIGDQCVNAVITTGVLEHVGDLEASLAEIDRVLLPGGQVFHEVPFVQGFHGTFDYRRFTNQGARALVKNYELIDEGVALGPSSALVWILTEYLGALLSFGNDRVHFVMSRLVSKVLRPLRFFDAFMEQRPQARSIACSLYVHARKPPGSAET